MPWCPKCGYEYVAGISECADCGCELTEKEPAPEQTLAPEMKRKREWPRNVPEMTLLSLLFPILTFFAPDLVGVLFIKLYPSAHTSELNDLLFADGKYAFMLFALLYGWFRKGSVKFSAIVAGWAISALLLFLVVMAAALFIGEEGERVCLPVVMIMLSSPFYLFFLWVGTIIPRRRVGAAVEVRVDG